MWLWPRKWQECGGIVSDLCEVCMPVQPHSCEKDSQCAEALHTSFHKCKYHTSISTYYTQTVCQVCQITHTVTLCPVTHDPLAVLLTDIKMQQGQCHDCVSYGGGGRGCALMLYSPAGSAERHRADRRAQLPAVPKPHLPTTHLHTQQHEKYCQHR